MHICLRCLAVDRLKTARKRECKVLVQHYYHASPQRDSTAHWTAVMSQLSALLCLCMQQMLCIVLPMRWNVHS